MALKRFRQLQGGFPFPPPSRQGTIFSPGTLGGALWGGCSFDPERGRIFVNSSELPSIITLVDAKPEEKFRFNHTGYEKFADPEGHPLVRPPWGHVTAIDLASGDFAWRAVHGEYPDLAAKGIRKTGAFQTGGTIATGGGLVFVAATPDEKFSAYSSDSGELVWQHALPAGGYATPCTYEAGGKQYVLIACGGGNRSKTPSGDQFMAFAL
jgi:quinoprotein glucose dehydrogenase